MERDEQAKVLSREGISIIVPDSQPSSTDPGELAEVSIYILPGPASSGASESEEQEVMPENPARSTVRKAWKPNPDTLLRSPAGKAAWELKKQRRDTRPRIEPLR